jgi:hypothetical protein
MWNKNKRCKVILGEKIDEINKLKRSETKCVCSFDKKFFKKSNFFLWLKRYLECADEAPC